MAAGLAMMGVGFAIMAAPAVGAAWTTVNAWTATQLTIHAGAITSAGLFVARVGVSAFVAGAVYSGLEQYGIVEDRGLGTKIMYLGAGFTFAGYLMQSTAAPYHYRTLASVRAAVKEGTTLYRVFGGEARGLGHYYTTVNPGSVPNFRVAAGLYPGNTGQFVLEGTSRNTEGVIFGTAALGPGGMGGGLPEVFVLNPQTLIDIIRVSDVNPAF